MKIKDLPSNKSLGGVKFYHPETKQVCVWVSQWSYLKGAAGVWYKKEGEEDESQIHSLSLKSLKEALEFRVVSNRKKQPCQKKPHKLKKTKSKKSYVTNRSLA